LVIHSIHIKERKKICLLTTVLVISLSAPGFAAPAIDLPDAGQALRNTQISERTLSPAEKPQLTVEEQVPRLPSEVDNGRKIRVDSIRITGQEIFVSAELAGLYQDKLHQDLTLAELNQVTAKITQYFKDHGYLVAQAYLPAQEIDKGSVEIAVLVGQYGEIILKNKSSVSDAVVKQQIAGLRSGAYITNQDLERAVLLAGDLAGVAAKVTLTPGKSIGTADCIVEVANKSGEIRGSINVNNWGNRFIGRIQSTVSYQVLNPTRSGDKLSLNLMSADNDISLIDASYRLPVAEGLTFNAGYSKVRYWLGEDYRYLDAHGTAYRKHADLTWAMLRSRNANLNVQFGYDHKTLRDLIDYSGVETNKTSHSISLGLSGDSRDSLWGGGLNAYAVAWYDGRLSAESNTTLPPTGHWQKTTYNFFRQQNLNDRLFLQTSLSGQWASTNLDSSERFSLGGATGVRAYPADEASGDEAWLFNGELHWNIPVAKSGHMLQLISFYDTGVSHIEKNSTNADNRRSLSGAGLGVLWGMPGSYAVKVNYAWKIGSAAAQSDTDKNGRLWLQAVKTF